MAMYTQLVLPAALQYEVLTAGFDDPTTGHVGTHKTYEKLRQRYYWRGFYQDGDHWCRSCVDCAMKKRPCHKIRAPSLPIPVDSASDRVAVDCLGPFPVTHSGNHCIVVFCDYYSRWPEAFAVPSVDEQPLLDCWWTRFCIGTVPHIPCCRPWQQRPLQFGFRRVLNNKYQEIEHVCLPSAI